MTETLPDVLSLAWDILTKGAAHRDAPARTLALASTAPDGAPEVRSVILRAADQTAATIDIHSDVRSPKVASFRAEPRAAALVWEPARQVQLRLSGPVTILTDTTAWLRVPAQARVSYGTTPRPGQPISGPFDYAPGDGATCFAVLRLSIDCIDVLHLGERHSRAVFLRWDGWKGHWLSP